MIPQSFRLALFAGAAFVVVAVAPAAHGQIYKCTDAAGKTVYSDSQCQPGTKPLKLPNEPDATATPSVCAELDDEIRRLTAASERSGSPLPNRARTLKKTYRARCAGLTRPPAR